MDGRNKAPQGKLCVMCYGFRLSALYLLLEKTLFGEGIYMRTIIRVQMCSILYYIMRHTQVYDYIYVLIAVICITLS